MNDAELDRQLKAAHPPERAEPYWDEFPARVMARLRAAPERRSITQSWRLRFAWGLGVALACLVIGFAFGHWYGRARATDSYALVKNGKLLREVLTLFPNRVRAIIQDEGGLHLMLSEQADVPPSTPLWIRICDRSQCRSVVTFSGQEVQIAGQRVEVLADAQGQILLLGERLFWSSGAPDRGLDNLRIQARSLAYVFKEGEGRL